MSTQRYGINLQVPNQYLKSWSREGLQLDLYYNTKILSNLCLQTFTYNNSLCSRHVNKHQVIYIKKLFQKIKYYTNNSQALLVSFSLQKIVMNTKVVQS